MEGGERRVYFLHPIVSNTEMEKHLLCISAPPTTTHALPLAFFFQTLFEFLCWNPGLDEAMVAGRAAWPGPTSVHDVSVLTCCNVMGNSY